MQSKQQFKMLAMPLWTNWLIKCNIRWERAPPNDDLWVNANTQRSLIFTQPAMLWLKSNKDGAGSLWLHNIATIPWKCL